MRETSRTVWFPAPIVAVILTVILAVGFAEPARSQSREPDPLVAAVFARPQVPGQDLLIGEWTYRSLRNNPDPAVEFNDLRFAVATITFEETLEGEILGNLGGTEWSLALRGNRGYGNPFNVRFQGKGEIGGELWVYDYVGYIVPSWPNREEQRPAIVGSVIRTKPHSDGSGGIARAGYVASFTAVKR